MTEIRVAIRIMKLTEGPLVPHRAAGSTGGCAHYSLPGPYTPRLGEHRWVAYPRALPGLPSYSRDHLAR
jgi:hypothetical protein